MGNLFVARRVGRQGLYLPLQGTRKDPDLMFFLPRVDRAELDEIVRATLAKHGITEESQVQAIIEKAEVEYEERIKVAEAKLEAKRLLGLKAEGKKLMSVGFRKWKEAFYPAIQKTKTEQGGLYNGGK